MVLTSSILFAGFVALKSRNSRLKPDDASADAAKDAIACFQGTNYTILSQMSV
jgi:hypothetical protein